MHSTPATDKRRWLGLALLCAAFFMVILDVAIVNVALPSIQGDLDFSQKNLPWVVSAYALMFGGLLLLGRRAADLLGRRRVFVAGVSLFALASLLAGLAVARDRAVRVEEQEREECALSARGDRQRRRAGEPLERPRSRSSISSDGRRYRPGARRGEAREVSSRSGRAGLNRGRRARSGRARCACRSGS